MPRRATRTTGPELTTEQQAQSDRIFETLRHAAESDLRELADVLATKDDTTIFGATEFTVRDIVLRVGAKAIETALEERKKGATTDPAAPAPAAKNPPSSNAGKPKPS
jgi:hypothetical protein